MLKEDSLDLLAAFMGVGDQVRAPGPRAESMPTVTGHS